MVALLLSPSRSNAEPTNSFVYRYADGHIDADIRSGSLESLLENVAMATGWHVFLDPGAHHAVSAKFKDLPTGQALHMLLGGVNFVVVPETNGPSRLYVFRTAQNQATRLIRAPAKPAKPIPNQLVVTLKPGSKTKIEDLARALGAKIIGRMDKQNSYLLQFDDDAATQAARAQLATNPDVAAVDYNYPVEQPPPVQLSQSTTPNLQLKPKPANGNCQLVVGLIDTAIQPVPANISSVVQTPLSVVGNYTPDPSQLTHGTAMLETLAQTLATTTGGSTSVKILPVDVYGANESTSTFNVAQGVATAINSGANVINLSLGSTGDSSVLRNIIAQGEQQGVAFYAAAGNTPVTTPTYPAAYPGVVAVTASGPNGQIADYANRGSFIQMMAPGDNVVGFDGQSYLVEGTSTATAFASGMAAGIADTHHACSDQAESLLKQSLGSTAIPTEAVDQ
ncbi:MAG TPA: S8 family serine peptidase [Candidatus Cybelea sp.]|nr:S8 family serine peptidase [Candidatus Cybelea sp.]